MELPHLGRNCALRECNQLDFLPVKCDACLEVFCVRHYQYESHNCRKAQNRDVQVPACPLCSEPVVGKRNELPDVAVSQHIDQFCRQNEALVKNRRLSRPKTNLQACTFRSCKQKDLIFLECTDCRAKFCIKHRHPSDHSCVGPSMTSNLAGNWQSFKGSCSSSASNNYELIKNKAQQISKSGQAALNRLVKSTADNSNHSGPNSSTILSTSNHAVANLQGNLSEQEALAIALSESRGGSSNPRYGATASDPHDEEDPALARALRESRQEALRRGQASSSKDSCTLS